VESLFRLAGRIRRRLAPAPRRGSELREFAEAEGGPPAAPEFRERLRERLWARLPRTQPPRTLDRD
jgi:hypothetical protein